MPSSHRSALAISFVAAALWASPVAAQRTDRAPKLGPVTWALDLGFGSTAGRRFGRGCGADATYGAAATLLGHIARVVVLEGSVGGQENVALIDCVTAEPWVNVAGPFTPWGVLPDRDPSQHAIATTVVRAGLETPREWSDGAVMRLTGGAGRMWGVDVPFRTVRLTSLVGRGRVLGSISFERWWFGLPVQGFTGTSAVEHVLWQTSPPDALRHLRDRSSTLRVGLEWTRGER